MAPRDSPNKKHDEEEVGEDILEDMADKVVETSEAKNTSSAKKITPKKNTSPKKRANRPKPLEIKDLKSIFNVCLSKAVKETASPAAKKDFFKKKDKTLSLLDSANSIPFPFPDATVADLKASEKNSPKSFTQVTESILNRGVIYMKDAKRADSSEQAQALEISDSDDEESTISLDRDSPIPNELEGGYVCRKCPTKPIPKTEFEFKARMQKFIASEVKKSYPTSPDINQDEPGCTRLPHPNMFFDEAFLAQPDKYPIFDFNKSQANLAELETWVKTSYPVNVCQCRRMFDFCIPCKYFNYIVTSVGHFLFVCFSQVLDELESYVNYLKEVHEKKTFGENQSDLLCNGCQLPMNGHESNAEFAKFPKCALPLEIKKHRVSMARIKLFYSAMDRNLSSDFGKAIEEWSSDRNFRKDGSDMLIYIRRMLEALKFATFLCVAHKSLAEASLSFTRLLFTKPTFQHEEGTCQPINTVLSIKRVHFILQHLILHVMPCVVNEYYADLTSDASAHLSESNQFMQNRIHRHKKKIEGLVIDILQSADTCIKDATVTYQKGFELTPLEIMTNFHRFNNSKHLQRYCGSFWSRAALMDVFKKTFESLRTMLLPLQKGNQFTTTRLSAEFANVEKELNKTKDWIVHLQQSFEHVVKSLNKLDEGGTGKKSKKCETAQALNQMKSGCTFCGKVSTDITKCSKCNLAQYCDEKCYETYRSHHTYLCCGKGGKDILNVLVGLSPSDFDEIIAANRKIRRGQSCTSPLLGSKTNE